MKYFSAGIAAIQDCVAQQTLPHMLRLLDLEETQLSFHFKSQKSPMQTMMDKAIKSIAIVAHKGSVPHHHSIGFEHAKWLPAMLRSPGFTWLQNIKSVIDPNCNLNPKNFELELIEEANG